MTNQDFTTAIAKNNQLGLQRLMRAIALSQGHFALILVRCNYQHLREQMLKNIRTISKNMDLPAVAIDPSTTSLLSNIVSSFDPDYLPSAVIVFGLDSVINIEDILTGINQERDIYAEILPFPLVLWLQDETASLLSKLAPDFKSWAATTIKFEIDHASLITLIQQDTEYLFNKILEIGAANFLSNNYLDLDPQSQQRDEMQSAQNDLLRLYGIELEPELQASLEFVYGRDQHINDQIEQAINHYQKSLNLWQNHQDSPNLLKQAVVLFHLGLCYRRMAALYRGNSQTYWQYALLKFNQCLNILEAAPRFDLMAKFILPACEMLHRLKFWRDLKTLTNQSLQLHQKYGIPAQIAQDYGFLADVAVSENNWSLAYQLINSAITIAQEITDMQGQQQSWYLLLLARIQKNLGEREEAINNLEWAKLVCDLQDEPYLYLEILSELRSLYFHELGNYAEAFKLKQETIQIEHQYGFRAFIGVNQLQPQRYRVNSVLSTPRKTFISEAIAQEISTSGRQQDVNRLVERIARTDYKLTVIHGPSGVGKSSILKAGLVPDLKGKVIGERIPLPIVLSVYTDWVMVCGRNISQAIENKALSTFKEFTPATILDQIRLAVAQNYIIILIFDQFEEFFFNGNSLTKRVEFYRFFSECLNIPFVKIILSLREDYLHYLLELERLGKQKHDHSYNLSVINENILDKDIRYYIGKFSKQEAIAIIDRLTKDSCFEIDKELTIQLVEDLAEQTDEVHPIELQIVGAQLQAENITTLEQYQGCGGSKKLVERWLEEVIKDCGTENETLSWQLLFELTDDKGTRPLKSKVDLGNILGENQTFDQVWELILEILVGSGLVVQIKEELGERYQLVHDYLVEPIRRKNNYGMVAELEKTKLAKDKAEVAQKLSQEKLNLALQQRLREARIAGLVLAVMAGIIGALWWQTNIQKRAAIRQTIRAERSETNLKISAIAAASEALFASNKEFDALLESLQAWKRLKQADGVQPDTRMRVITALQQAVYGVTEMNRLEGHTDILWGVTFSPDGKLLASGSRDRTVKIWRVDGMLLQTLKGHTDAVSSLNFSPDGQILASASLDRTIQLWRKNPNTGLFDAQPFKKITGHKDWIYSLNFSPDGELLATGSKDTTIRLWRKDGSLVKILKGHQGWVNWVTFSPDGQYIASASDDKTVKIWRRDGTLVKTLSEHQQGVTVVSFSPNGQVLASAGRDHTVKLWQWQPNNSEDGFKVTLDKTLLEHTGMIWSLSFSADGQKLASSGDDNTINLWTVNGNLIKTFRGNSDGVSSVVFSPDSQILVSASYDKTIKIWSLDTSKLPVLRGHGDRVLSVAWSPDGQMLASGSRDRTIKLWRRSAKTGKVETTLYKTLRGHTDRVPSVSFDPKGEMLASASYDATIKLWDRDGAIIQTLLGHNDSVMSVSFSPDGEILASASKDQTVKLWNRQGKLLKTLVGHQGWVNNVSFSPDGQVLASASDDQTVRLWRQDGTLISTLLPHQGWVLGISFSPTDQILASASWDNTVKLWRQDGTFLKTLLKGYSDSVNAVTFSPNGELLAAASWDSTVKIWSREGKLIKTLSGHNAPVFSISFSPDGQTLASASDDNTIILWNLNLDDLLLHGCSWLSNYLKYNQNVEESDRRLCHGIVN
ncbi:hypothetical protein VB711_00915 [Cronbergia sp. UHCC 0137]|uniref:WD40 domain-containing protein n=1 Tax=Cronbergia sp. UHCC 0137 TaxID=3110239 RepID=UPI002B217064|nr:hypothetical protein [Cronbergia sp. UHCC 0137]MEA5616405.1 hypothetical protein [Cronbergia sp. UHCC 0137]